jgi:hypothetical protein
MIFAIVAAVAAGLFTGAAVYITLVEHPARLECGPALALTEFAPSYRRATVMQASLALLGGLAGAAAWLSGAGWGWLVGGLLLASVIPYTLLAILPTNRELLGGVSPTDAARVTHLLGRWGRLHILRGVLGGAAFVLFVSLLAHARW